jgi:hypothetical protein
MACKLQKENITPKWWKQAISLDVQLYLVHICDISNYEIEYNLT